MTSSRSSRVFYFAAFLLGALLALLLASPARAADPFRLDRVAVVQFSPVGADRLLRRTGVMDLEGRTTWRVTSEIARPASTPVWALDRVLIDLTAWRAYGDLGFGALQGFTLEEGGVSAFIGNDVFKFVGPNPDGVVNNGAVTNLSTRATLLNAQDEITAGFVIETRARAVLIRVIGPGLTRFGVTNAAADPFLTVKKNGQTVYMNDNWSTQANAALVATAAAQVGAFPLDAGSRDAARVVMLPPGVYTAHASAATAVAGGGNVLIELYRLPDDPLYEETLVRHASTNSS